jgi:hypothetical protein
MKTEDGSIAKGFVAGIAGGLVASVVMNQFQSAVSKLMSGDGRGHGAQTQQHGTPEHGVGEMLRERGSDEPHDNAAVRAGNAIAEFVFDKKLTKSEKEIVGTVAHYAMGAASGAIYGAARELRPEVSVADGVPFGAAVWLIADEGIVPAVGLSKQAKDYPLSIHAYALAAHIVYGVTTELVTRAVRRAL